MGLYDDNEDDDQAPVDALPELTPEEKANLIKNFGLSANMKDDAGVKAAEADADRRNLSTGIFQGLSTAFAGPHKTDSGFYNSLRSEAQGDVKSAQDAFNKKQGIAQYIIASDAKLKAKADALAAKQQGASWTKDPQLDADGFEVLRNTSGEVKRGARVVSKEVKEPKGSYVQMEDPETGEAVMYNPLTGDTKRPGLKSKGADNQPKDVQLSAAGFGKRASAANQRLQELLDSGYDPTSAGAAFRKNVPFVSSFTTNNEDKLHDQAARDFISAVLRKESGAAISDKEIENEKLKYFPATGDTSDVLTQKADSRARAIAALKAEAGDNAWAKVADVPSTPLGRKVPSGTAIAARLKPTPMDVQALDWLKSNPKDPAAPAVRAKLKAKGIL